MCFCASASFVAAGILGGLGIWSLASVRKKNWIPFALRALETRHKIRNVLTWLVRGGGLIATYSLYILLWYGASASLVGNSIKYLVAIDAVPIDWSLLLLRVLII